MKLFFIFRRLRFLSRPTKDTNLRLTNLVIIENALFSSDA